MSYIDTKNDELKALQAKLNADLKAHVKQLNAAAKKWDVEAAAFKFAKEYLEDKGYSETKSTSEDVLFSNGAGRAIQLPKPKAKVNAEIKPENATPAGQSNRWVIAAWIYSITVGSLVFVLKMLNNNYLYYPVLGFWSDLLILFGFVTEPPLPFSAETMTILKIVDAFLFGPIILAWVLLAILVLYFIVKRLYVIFSDPASASESAVTVGEATDFVGLGPVVRLAQVSLVIGYGLKELGSTLLDGTDRTLVDAEAIRIVKDMSEQFEKAKADINEQFRKKIISATEEIKKQVHDSIDATLAKSVAPKSAI